MSRTPTKVTRQFKLLVSDPVPPQCQDLRVSPDRPVHLLNHSLLTLVPSGHHLTFRGQNKFLKVEFFYLSDVYGGFIHFANI